MENQLPAPQSNPVPAVPAVLPRTYAEPAQSQYAAEPPAEPDSGLLEYWRILRRRKGTLIIMAFVGGVVGVLVTLPQTPVYQARTSLEIQDTNDNFMNMKQNSPVNESGMGYSAMADIQTQIKILQSDTMLQRTAAKLKVTEAGSLKPQPSRVDQWFKALNLPVLQTVTDDAAISMARSQLKVRAAGQTRIIEVLCDSPNPKVAADFANILANGFIDQNIEARWQMTQRTGEWLSRQLDEMRIKLEKSEDSLQAYARGAGLMYTGEKESLAEDKLKLLQTQLSVVHATRIAKQSNLEMADSSPPEALPDVLNDTSLRSIQDKITDLKRQTAELGSTYKPEYSKVKRIESQIAPLQAAFDGQRNAILKRIRNEFDEADRQETLLTESYTAQTKLVNDQSEKSIQYTILKREVDSNRQLYEGMLQKVKESTIASALRASNIRVIDAAAVPAKPYKPNATQNGEIGLLGGLFLGIAFVVMRERADRTIQDPGDSEFYLNTTELGIIPSADAGMRRSLYYNRRRKEIPASTTAVQQLNSQDQRVELVTWQKKSSMVSESFRSVLTSILFTGQNGSRPRVLAITSAGPSEGKTTVTANLAITLAEIKRKVLLVDGDLRRPRIHGLFGVPNERGLANLLEQASVSDADLEALIHETKIPGLFVLPSGPETSSAANLLHSPVLPELLARWKSQYDMVLIDTPPMLQMPDARVVGKLADALILVVKSGHTTRNAAIAVKQRLADDNIRLLGSILNNWNPKNSPGGYYGYYDGYYSKGYARYYSKTTE